MNMEKKFREALLHVLEDGTFKNVRALALEADVDQAGLSRFLATMGFGGKSDVPKLAKSSLNLQSVSKLMDTMGGTVVFPWEETELTNQDNSKQTQRIKDLEEELAQLKVKLDAQNDELIELRGIDKKFDKLLRHMAQSQRPNEVREDKSCA